MSVTTWGWLIIAFPLAGSILIGLTFRLLPPRAAGAIGTLSIALAFACSVGALLAMLDHPADAARVHEHALRLRRRGRDPVRARDPGRPALDLHGARRHRRLGPDPPLLVRLHGRGRGLQALLLLPQLLRLLDAAAGPRRQLPPADRRLGLRRLRLLRADQLLVPARDRDQGGHEGVRDQRDRRHRPDVRGDPADQGARRHRVRAGLRRRRRSLQPPTSGRSSRSACC